MSRSGLAQIAWSPKQGLSLVCTDPSAFEWALAELVKVAPGCKVEKSVPKYAFIEPFEAEIWGFRGGEYAVALWIVKQLCEKGWEPFDAAGWTPQAEFGHVLLRLVGRAD